MFHISFHKCITAHAKKETPAFFSRPVAEPKGIPAAMHGVRWCRMFLPSLSVPKHSAQPLGRMSLCPIFTNRKQWKYYNKGELDCQDSAKSNKKSRLCRQERTGKNRIPVSISSIEPGSNVRLSTMYSHEMSAATRRSEMTLDYSFLSDSRNFFV